MKDENKIDDIFKKSLASYEVDFNEKHWEEMDALLDAEAPVPGSWFSRNRKYFFFLSAFLIFLLVGYLGINQVKNTPQNQNTVKSSLINNPLNIGKVNNQVKDQAKVEAVDTKTSTDIEVMEASIDANKKSSNGATMLNANESNASEEALELPAISKNKKENTQTNKQDANNTTDIDESAVPGANAVKTDLSKSNSILPKQNKANNKELDKKPVVKEMINVVAEVDVESETESNIENELATVYKNETSNDNQSFDRSSDQVGNQNIEAAVSENDLESISNAVALPVSENGLETISALTGLEVALEEEELMADILSKKETRPFVAPKIIRSNTGFGIGALASGEVNYVDDVENNRFGHSQGLFLEYNLGNVVSLESAFILSSKTFQSDDVNNVPYVVGNVEKSQVKYSFIEIPLLARFKFRKNKKFQPHVGGGHSVYIARKEKYFFVTDLEVDESFENDYNPTPSTSNYESFEDSRNLDSEGSNIFASQPESQSQQAQERSGDVAALPQNQKSAPFFGIINFSAGFDMSLGKNAQHTLRMEGQFKSSINKLAYDLRIADYPVSNQKRYKSLGARLSYIYHL